MAMLQSKEFARGNWGKFSLNDILREAEASRNAGHEHGAQAGAYEADLQKDR